MRCLACNKELTDAEAVRKDAYGYIEMCSHCYDLGQDDEEPDLSNWENEGGDWYDEEDE